MNKITLCKSGRVYSAESLFEELVTQQDIKVNPESNRDLIIGVVNAYNSSLRPGEKPYKVIKRI